MSDDYSEQLAPILLKIDAQIDGKTARKIISQTAADIHSDVGEYPGTSPANFPPGNNGYSWYERAIGTKTRTGRTYATSQRFNSKWPSMPRFINDFKAVYDNKTTYGGYLMGDVQVAWAKGVGWKKLRKVLEENSAKYVKRAAKVIAQVNKA